MADKPQSKFWAGSDTSGSDSDSSESSGSEGEVQQKQEEKNVWQYESDSSGDEAQRVVKSAKDKAEEAFEKTHQEIRNSININDWNNIAALFGKLSGLITKHADAITSTVSGSIENYPEYYFLSLKSIQDAIDKLSATRAAQKKLSKTNGKSFNVMKARMKKLITDEHKARMAECEAKINEMESDSDSSSDSDSDSSDSDSSSSEYDSSGEEASDSEDSGSSSSDSESDEEGKVKKSKLLVGSDSDWGSDSDSSSSSSDEGGPQLTGRARWLKKVPNQQNKLNIDERRAKDQEKQERAKQRKLQKEADAIKKQEQQTQEEEFTKEIATEKVKELLLERGKRSTDRMKLVEELKVLVDRSVVFGFKFQLPLKMHLIALMFDVKSGLDDYMPVDLWIRCLNLISNVLNAVEEHELIFEHMSGDEDADAAAEAANPKVLRVLGDLSTFVDRLNSEYEKSLRYMENHSEDYVNRLQHEGYIIELSKRVFKYYQRVNDPLKGAMMSIINLSNLFYKHEKLAKPVFQAYLLTKRFAARKFWHPAAIGTENTKYHPAAQLGSLIKLVTDVPEVQQFNLEKEILADCEFIYKHGTAEMKCFATLSQVYHYALHDQYYKARDLLLMSKLQEHIYSFDVESQILFNRTLAQLGFCAFRQGNFKRCHSCLMDLCQQGSKTKELLAQGVYWRKQMQGMDTKALEAFQRKERRRLLPYHLHINLDLLEFFHLTSAMLLEVPTMALQERSTQGKHQNKVISRTFRRYVEQYQKQVFTGPPENTRDHVVVASLALTEGNWRKCRDLLFKLSIWKLFTSREEETKQLLEEEIKKQALRTYLIKYGAIYSSVSAKYLQDMFDLEEAEIKHFVGKLILEDEVKGSWEQGHNNEWVVKLRSNEPTHLQALASRYALELEKLVEANEKKSSKGSTFDGFGSQREDGKKRGIRYRKNNMKRRAIKS